MTLDDVKAELQRLERIKGDEEAAHAAEDTLYASVLRSIASGDHDAQSAALLAQEALKAEQIVFVRYYA